MRLIDAHGSYTISASDNTGYSLAFGGGIISVVDEFGHIEAEFDADDAHIIDAVTVVRCRECKHSSLPSKITQIYGKEGTLTCHYGPCNRRNVSMNDFCSCGERKEDGA